VPGQLAHRLLGVFAGAAVFLAEVDVVFQAGEQELAQGLPGY
jgi:hypothetical protein